MAGTSSLGRLFEYAKVSTVDIRENYTTQALAEAIRRDPRPMVLALAHAGVLDIDATRSWEAEVTTQWAFPDTIAAGADAVVPDAEEAVLPSYRFVDLVLLLRSENESVEVWVEVKTGSGIHGDQLERYRAYIDGHNDEIARTLVLLAPEKLPTNVALVSIRWRDVADAIERSSTQRDWWLDFATYLEEIGMTEHWTLPVTAREAIALEDAHHLFRKAFAVIDDVNGRIRDGATTPAGNSFPVWFPWPQSWVLRTCQSQFAEHGRIMLSETGERPVSIFYGYAPMGGEVVMAVWIEANPRNTTARQTVRSWAATRLPEWQRVGDEWQIVQQTQRAILVESRDEAVGWFLGRLGELIDAGLYSQVYPDPAPASR